MAILLPDDAFSQGDAARLGVGSRTLYRLLEKGQIERIGRGLYRRADLAPVAFDYIEIAHGRPDATICLVSALAQHDLVDAIPNWIDIALPRGQRGATTPGSRRVAPIRQGQFRYREDADVDWQWRSKHRHLLCGTLYRRLLPHARPSRVRDRHRGVTPLVTTRWVAGSLVRDCEAVAACLRASPNRSGVSGMRPAQIYAALQRYAREHGRSTNEILAL